MTNIGLKAGRVLTVAALALAIALCFSLWNAAAQAQNKPRLTSSEARIAGDDARTRIVLDFDVAPQISVHYLQNPKRIIVDLDETDFTFPGDQLKARGIYNDIRYGAMAPGTSRVVLSLLRPAKLVIAETQANESGTGYRLVLDGEMTTEESFAELVKSQNWKKTTVETGKGDRLGTAPEPESSIFTIAVDAGHGGIDTGAVGVDSKTEEKTLTLEFARALVNSLNADGGVHAFLVRDTDIFLSLPERVMIARQKNANLFISIHADTLPQKDIRGATVYTISDRASDNLAAAMASRENKSDDIAGVPLNEEPAEVADILIDLARRETQAFSITLADTILKSFEGEINLINNPHRSAGFRVLMAPDVPSVLVELGFLSNREDEAMLLDESFRDKVAKRLTDAVRAYREGLAKKAG